MPNKRTGDLHLDGTDLRILAELVENSKSSYVEIGKRLGLHPNVVAYRVNRMEESGIIREYTAHADFSKLVLSEQVFVSAYFPNCSPREYLLKQISDIHGT